MTMRLRAEVSTANTDNGLVLLDERAGRYWQLNPTGALVLHLLLDGMTPHQVAQTLADRHPVSTDHQCTVHTRSPYDVSTKDLGQVLVQRVTLFGRLRHAGVPVWIDGQGIQALNACLAKDVGRLGNEPLSLLEALSLYRPDVALRVLVAGIQVAGIGVIGFEFQKLLAQVLAHLERRVAAEIGEGVVLFLSHVIAVGDPDLPYGVPPLRTADRVLGCLAHPVPDVVVVADRIDGLVLGVVATTQ